MSQNNPKAGEIYRHFKNKLYKVITIARHSETGEMLVIYEALYGDFSVYARPYAMFTSEVDHTKYPDATEKYRFTLVEKESLQNVKTQYEKPQDRQIEQEHENTQEITAKDNGRKIFHPHDFDSKDIKMQQDPVFSEMPSSDVNQKLLAFLDTEDLDKKYEIVKEMQEDMTDALIDNMAASMDCVILEGPMDKRIRDLQNCIRTHQKYEKNNRFGR